MERLQIRKSTNHKYKGKRKLGQEKRKPAGRLSLSLRRLSLSLSLSLSLTDETVMDGPVMDIHNMVYNI